MSGTQETTASGSVVVVDALAARTGGTAHAAVEVARRLAHGPGAEIIVVAHTGSIVARGIEQGPGLRLHALPRPARLELVRRLAWQALGLPELVRREGAASVLTWSGMLPTGVDGRVVCYLGNSLMFARGGAANALRRLAVRLTVHRGADVLVPSRAMAELVGEALGVQPEAVPLGVDHARFRPATEPGTELLCVADFYRHKRHDVLLDAWAALPSPRPRLRLIGDPTVDRSSHREVTSRAARYRELGEIAFESGLSSDKVADAYRGARVFAVASEQESFCLPLLEAQACGVPAVARDLPVLRETGGEGTTYISGDEPRAWAAAMLRLLTDEGAWTAARAEGLEHARGFSWEKTTAAVRALLLPG
jgi:glycosyltransferase involved in cell wall biosynthesis